MVDRELVDAALSSVLNALERTPAAIKAHPPLSDADLLNDLITLVTGLEQERARTAERRAGGEGLDGLLLLTSVVNALIAFVTERSADSRVLPSRVLAELADADPYTQLLGEEDEHITVGTAVAVLSNWTGKPEDRRGMIDDLCRALLDVLATYSESISALFHDAPLRDEWRETFTVFADDLRLAAQRMAA
jgi:hypothetical protein